MPDHAKKVVSLAPKRRKAKPKCPICARAAETEFKPFCSKRCADADLAKWLGGDYKLPTNERPDEADEDKE